MGRVGLIRRTTGFYNVDNIARTKAYEAFAKRYPEIRWALLAGMVSRNAGWNMTDLCRAPYRQLLSNKRANEIFKIYERANWLIFDDAYPQLLVYAASKKKGRPLFHLLFPLGISRFMEREWQRFWDERDESRLLTALIINEQEMLQMRLMERALAGQLFHSVLYILEEHAHFSFVLLPDARGNLYVRSVRDFAQAHARIELGKQLAALLYHPDCGTEIATFARITEPTGSRHDYERRQPRNLSEKAPLLRVAYPRIAHGAPHREDWFSNRSQIEDLFTPVQLKRPKDESAWVREKALEVRAMAWLHDKLFL
ncbi:DUF2515 family protein [Shouchella shacheensis]|uniref:DUF2515 family protein n=1 Tax=Shouchella shacheensis TaxID=1649580 RepID=UPI00074003A9|nr:DUF2515 family protein [Shouchella shacheensis]